VSITATNVQRIYYDDSEIQSALISQMKGRECAFIVSAPDKESFCKRGLEIFDRDTLMKSLHSVESSYKSNCASVLSSIEKFTRIRELDSLGSSLRTDWDFVMDIDSAKRCPKCDVDMTLKGEYFICPTCNTSSLFDRSLTGPRECALAVSHLFTNIGFRSFKLKFSGQKGFHVIIHSEAFKGTVLDKSAWVKSYPSSAKILAAFVKAHIPKKSLNDAKIEYSNFYNPRRLLRIAYSLHNSSRLVSIPLSHDDLKSFSIEDARPDNVRSIDWDWLNFRSGSDNADDLLHAAFEWRSYVEKAIEKKDKLTHPSVRRYIVRPCISTALSNPTLPHLMRVAIASEYLAAGYSDVEIIRMFSHQSDFKASYTSYQIKNIKSKGRPPFRCATISEMGFCLKQLCPRYHKSNGRD